MESLSYFRRKLPSLEKLFILQDFSSSTWRHCKRAIISKCSLLPRLDISSHSLATTENMISTQGGIFLEYIIIYWWLDLQQHSPLPFSIIIILVFHILSKMIHHLSSHLFWISAWYRGVFENDVEILYTRLMPVSSVDLNSSHEILEEKWIISTPFMAKNQINIQESGT